MILKIYFVSLYIIPSIVFWTQVNEFAAKTSLLTLKKKKSFLWLFLPGRIVYDRDLYISVDIITYLIITYLVQKKTSLYDQYDRK